MKSGADQLELEQMGRIFAPQRLVRSVEPLSKSRWNNQRHYFRPSLGAPPVTKYYFCSTSNKTLIGSEQTAFDVTDKLPDDEHFLQFGPTWRPPRAPA